MANAPQKAYDRSPGADRVVEIGADEAARLATLWAYKDERIVEPSVTRPRAAASKAYVNRHQVLSCFVPAGIIPETL
jgi:hypothetical protein